jgi:hypothetical protein
VALTTKARENDGRHLGFRFKPVFSTSGLFFAENGLFFRSGEMAAPRGEKKAKKKGTRTAPGARLQALPPPPSRPGRISRRRQPFQTHKL